MSDIDSTDKQKLQILIVEDGEGEAKLIAKFLRIRFLETLDILEVVTANDLLNFIKAFPNNEMRFDITLADNTNEEGKEKIFFHQEISRMAEETLRKLGYIVNISGGEDDFEMIKKIVGEEYTGSALKGINFSDKIIAEVKKGMDIMNKYRSTPEQYKTSQFFLDELDKYKDVLKDNTTEDAKFLKKEIAVIYSELLQGLDGKEGCHTVELGKRLKGVRNHELLEGQINNDDIIMTDDFIQAIKRALNDVIRIGDQAINDNDIEKIYKAYINAQEIRSLIDLFGEGCINNPYLADRLKEYIGLVINASQSIAFKFYEFEHEIDSEKGMKEIKDRHKQYKKEIQTSKGTEEMLKVKEMSYEELEGLLKKEKVTIEKENGFDINNKKINFSMQMFYFISKQLGYPYNYKISFKFRENGVSIVFSKNDLKKADIGSKEDANIRFVIENYLNGKFIHNDDSENGKVSFSATFPYLEK